MKLLRLLLVIASGLMLSFAFPPMNLSLLVWVWMVPLLYALWGGSPRSGHETVKKKRFAWLRPFLLGWVGGFVFFVSTFSWARHSTRVIYGAKGMEWMGWSVELTGWAAVIFLCAFLAIYWGLWALFATTIGRPRLKGMLEGTRGKTDAMFDLSLESLRSAFLNAAAWVACEWLRGIVFTGFGWNGVAVPMISELALVQAADLIGVTGLSFLPVFSSCILYNTVLRFQEEARASRVRPHLDFFVAVVLLLADFLYGFLLLSTPHQGETVPLHVLLVQMNISQADEWNKSKAGEIKRDYGDITRKFFTKDGPQKTDLVVWPESALPHPIYDPNDIPFLMEVLGYGDFSLMAGTDIVLPEEPIYTGAALMHGDLKDVQLYRKVHLVPFGEYLPMRSFPLVNSLLGGMLPGDLAPGDSTEPLGLDKPAGVQIIPLICFEDTVGRLAREFVRDVPQLIVNCTNDGWFLHSPQNEQHLLNARFRCIELRRPMVRAANTGVTGYVSTEGRMNREDRLQNPKTDSVFIRGAFPKEILLEKHPPMTFYAQHGDLFSIVMLVIAALAIPATILIRRPPRSGRFSASSTALG